MRPLLAAVIAAGMAAVVLLVVLGIGPGHESSTRGDSAPRLISSFGCGGCHTIAGIDRADGRVGPSLRHLGRRRTIAGTLVNTPENLARWIDDPKAVNPRTLMPDLRVTRAQAREIADYLESH